MRYPDVEKLYYEDGWAAIIYVEKKADRGILHRLDLKTLKNETITETRGRFENVRLDKTGKCIALFEFPNALSEENPFIIFYDNTTKKLQRFNAASLGIGSEYSIGTDYRSLSFAANASVLIFSQKGKDQPPLQLDTAGTSLNLWNYKLTFPKMDIIPVFDDMQAMLEGPLDKHFKTALNIKTGKIERLSTEADSLGLNSLIPCPENASYIIFLSRYTANHRVRKPFVHTLVNVISGKRTFT